MAEDYKYDPNAPDVAAIIAHLDAVLSEQIPDYRPPKDYASRMGKLVVPEAMQSAATHRAEEQSPAGAEWSDERIDVIDADAHSSDIWAFLYDPASS